MARYQLPKEVLKVLDQASKAAGEYQEERFNINTWNECFDCGMESPIEQILYIAFQSVRQTTDIERLDSIRIDGKDYAQGMGLQAQYRIDKYRADFLGVYIPAHETSTEKKSRQKSVVVECDSQQFHERTEKERRYEKARDRFFQRKGYTVFRYTGKEIMDNPFKVACEIIGYLLGQDENEIYNEYMVFMQ